MVWLTKDLEGVEMVQKLAEELQRQVEPFDLDETACQILIFATALEATKNVKKRLNYTNYFCKEAIFE